MESYPARRNTPRVEVRSDGYEAGPPVGLHRTFIAGSSTASYVTSSSELDSLCSSVTSSGFLDHIGIRAVLTSPQVNKF